MKLIYEFVGKLYFNTYNYLINYYNIINYKLFDVNKIHIYCNQKDRSSNLYIYYILMKCCMFLNLDLFINLINYLTFDKYKIIDVHIKTKVRECKFLYKGNLFNLINYMDDHKYIKDQINLPNKYIIRSCELNGHKDIHHLLYLYYDPKIIFPNNTIINIITPCV